MRIIIPIFLIGLSYACSCMEPPLPEEAYEDADVVFSGEVINIVLDDSDYFYFEVTFQIIDIWKGDFQDEITILTATDSAACGVGFQINNEYLVYGYGNESEIHTDICTRTNLLQYAHEDLDYLNGLDDECDDSTVLLTMEDSWGDGWNGNTFCLNEECTTLPFGSFGTYEFCIDLSIENIITCGGGNWQSEVFWSLSDSEGITLATGGAPFDGCVGGSCENDIIESFEFNDNGQIRDYYLYQPSTIEDNAPLVFVLHGYSGTAYGMIDYSGMNAVAAEHGFAVCYPQGLSDDGGYNFWNVGYSFHENQTVNDVAFLSSLAEHLQNEYGFDSQNTFSTGFSNGGDMSYMLACQAHDVFRAVAPVAGCMMEEFYDLWNSSVFASPVPVFEIHGTNDYVVPWEGDMENSLGWGASYGTQEGIDAWVQNNGCVNYEHFIMPNTNLEDGSYVINHRYFDCIDNAEVWLYEVVGGGHDWPGSSGNMDINASEEIWSFFNQYTYILGDINNDGSVDVMDAIEVVGLVLDGEYNEVVDMNYDGNVNILDIIEIIYIILN